MYLLVKEIIVYSILLQINNISKIYPSDWAILIHKFRKEYDTFYYNEKTVFHNTILLSSTSFWQASLNAS